MKTSKLNASRIAIAFFGSALLLLGACNQGSKEQPEPATQLTSLPEGHIDRPKGMIWLDEAKKLCDNYENRRIPTIEKFEAAQNNGEEKFIPVQFVSFDWKTISTYVKYVEQEAKEANVAPDSLRIYLGNYGEKGRDPNRNTVFLLPAAQVGNAYGGFYIEENGQAKLIRDYWPKEGEDGNQGGGPKSKASLMPTMNFSAMHGGGSMILNFGQGGPPPYGDF